MRAQQVAILDAIAEAKSTAGVVRIGVGFMTLAELITGGEAVLAELNFPPEINRNTVQAWLRGGLLYDAEKRQARNRLYSAVDVALLVGVALVSRLGFSQSLAKGVSIALKHQLSKNLTAALVKPNNARQLFIDKGFGRNDTHLSNIEIFFGDGMG